MIIADAKRGDIGNTATMYARTFFEQLEVDAVTLAPYMGKDTVDPFLAYPGKWVILLGLTSNAGAEDFQLLNLEVDGREKEKKLYEAVIDTASGWAGPDQMMFVAGATRAELLAGIRSMVPEHFLLVPGIGAQGGSLEEVARHGMNKHCGLIVNASRSILYADSSRSFAKSARKQALSLQQSMSDLIQ
jgi:orotidine-5'-phosphate decarboxylase